MSYLNKFAQKVTPPLGNEN